MKVIFSYVSNRRANGYNQQYLEIAALANYLVKKHHNLETVFSGDEQSLQAFGNINYNHFIKISQNELKDIPNFLWSIGKYVAIQKINEPFLHLDLDILLFRPLKEEVFQKDIVCFHNEHFSNHIMWQIQNTVNIKPQRCIGHPDISYNCVIFGGRDINTIKYSIDILLNYIKENKQVLEKINTNYHKRPNNEKLEYFDLSVFIEQVWLFQLFKLFNKEIYEITYASDLVGGYKEMIEKTGYAHLISWGKDIYRDKIKNTVNQLNIKY